MAAGSLASGKCKSEIGVTDRLKTLHGLVEPVVQSLQCEVWGIEFIGQGRKSTLRVYIDSASGVGLSECEKVSRQLSAIFDVEDPIAQEYTLEVSSPGMARPLFTLEQYSKSVGCRVDIRLHSAFSGRRRYRGAVLGVEGEDVVIVCDDTEYLFPFESIDKANIIPQW